MKFKRLQYTFALSEKGASDLVKAIIWSFICNLSLMLPVGAIMMTIQHMMASMDNGTSVTEGALPIIIFAIAVVVLLFILHWFQYASLYIAVYKESATRRISLAEILRKLPLSFFGQRDLSDLTSTMIADCSSLDQIFSHYIPQLFASILSTFVIGIMMFAINWKMALSILWVFPIAILLTVGSRSLQDKYGTKSILAKRNVTEAIQEDIEVIKDIKAYNAQGKAISCLDSLLRQSEKSSIHSELVTGTLVSSAQAFMKIGLATTVLVGVSLLSKGELSLLYFIGFLFASARIYDPLCIELQNIAATFSAKLKIERMRAIENEPVQTGSDICNPDGYDIVFDHVKFSYRDGEGVLDDVSFTARQGEVTALVGPSGGGKSTACKLAARFWDIQGGKITLGGVDISKIDPEKLMENYSFVFQDVVLFQDSIIENIRLGRKSATDEEVYAAAKAARCEEFISALSDGYNTVIGENGLTLSGGERQRISIARALLKDAPVILLDEATAALDVENESEVQKAISRLIKNKTVLIIAHRMRTVVEADKVIVLSDGIVKEEGRPDDLLNKNGIFSHMAKLQAESQEWKI